MDQNYIIAIGFIIWTSGVNNTMVLIIWYIDFILKRLRETHRTPLLNMFEVFRPSASSGCVDRVCRGGDRGLRNRASCEVMKETEEEKNNRTLDPSTYLPMLTVKEYGSPAQ